MYLLEGCLPQDELRQCFAGIKRFMKMAEVNTPSQPLQRRPFTEPQFLSSDGKWVTSRSFRQRGFASQLHAGLFG